MRRKPCRDPRGVRLDAFAMRVNAEERHMLAALAKRLQRTKSDTVRLLVREAHRALAGERKVDEAGRQEGCGHE